MLRHDQEFPSERVLVAQDLVSCLNRQHFRGRRHRTGSLVYLVLKRISTFKKGITLVHPVIKIRSLFIHSLVVPSLYDCNCSVEKKICRMTAIHFQFVEKDTQKVNSDGE